MFEEEAQEEMDGVVESEKEEMEDEVEDRRDEYWREKMKSEGDG